MWFRITTNRDGSIAECAQVEGSLCYNGKRVHYIEAESKEQAISILAARYDRLLEQGKASTLKHRDALSVDKCLGCPAEARAGGRYCIDCLLKKRERRIALAAGGERLRKAPARTATEKAASYRDKLDRLKKTQKKLGGGSTRNYEKLCFLRSLLRRYDENPKHFRAWLIAEIDKRAGKSVKAA